MDLAVPHAVSRWSYDLVWVDWENKPIVYRSTQSTRNAWRRQRACSLDLSQCVQQSDKVDFTSSNSHVQSVPCHSAIGRCTQKDFPNIGSTACVSVKTTQCCGAPRGKWLAVMMEAVASKDVIVESRRTPCLLPRIRSFSS